MLCYVLGLCGREKRVASGTPCLQRYWCR